MSGPDVQVGSWKPHKPRGPISAHYTSPGPKYALPPLIGNKKKGYSFGKTHCKLSSDRSPGPKYLLPSNVTRVGRDGIPAFSIHSRIKDPEPFLVPGPGPAAYTLPPVLGPHTLTTTTAPSYSLYGRSNKGGFQEDLQKSPGPGTYKVVDPCVSKRRAPWYSMRGRNIISYDTRETPGPGTYYPEQVTLTRQKAPSFSFGVRHSEYIVPLSENEDN
ncbi:outer dense fiber protein 3-B-like [Myripristis murdjan]|uniref:outer dense fiber protein 3-B-like n=1 Tax=Myripristis murdjan TaxID=586833 RepID=UPI0011761FF0|nr:outer dense fiber protein 3-B-like [Myripristis murdjan]